MKLKIFKRKYRQQFSIIGIIFFSVAFSNIFVNKSLAIPTINHRDSVVKHLLGKMTASIQQAESRPIQVRMTTCLVNVISNNNSIFLYQEQGFIGSLNQPYRQRFLEITTENKQTKQYRQNLVFSHSYKPDDLSQWVNFCQSDRVQDKINQTEIGQLVCTITLKPLLSVYVGQTPPQGCPTKARGAATVTNSIVLHEQGMETWDRGFDTQGKQLWGARKKPYQFFWDTHE